MDKYAKTNLTRALRDGCYTIEEFDVLTAADRRLADLGFVKGTKIKVLSKALFNATMAVVVRNSTICIRREQADRIILKRV